MHEYYKFMNMAFYILLQNSKVMSEVCENETQAEGNSIH